MIGVGGRQRSRKALGNHEFAVPAGYNWGNLPVIIPKPDHEAFLTTDEVLAYLQVNLRTVYRLIDAGKLPAVRVGRQWRFRRADIDAWLDQRPPAAGRPGPVPVPHPPPAGPGRRVLVVDPDGASRDVLSSALRAAGHTVDTAPDGVVAAERLARHSYDLLVSELRIPGLDAFALVRDARRAAPGLRLMIVTSHSTEAAAIEALNFGVAGYLVKPSRPAEIAATAARVLGQRPVAS